ncbi:MAG: phosphoglucosamine mutase [Thermoleophilaceae bacterium]|nr:phosphoglucosamine mutase [Thermoleophilaceae bacterium]
MPARKLFGTDGVRGRADEIFSDDFVESLGQAVVAELGGDHASIAILRDTRESGPRIEQAFARGAAAAGADVKLAGVLPTPAAPVLIQHFGFSLVAVVSASHNPFYDNGIKFFGADGMKLGDAVEARIEARMAAHGDTQDTAAAHQRTGSITELHGAELDYLRAVNQRFGELDLTGWKILIDCANGATYNVAPEMLRRLGASVDVLGDKPDGININEGCGSTHLELLTAAIQAGDYDIGFAFDGDGDRLMAVDADGRALDGDELIALAASHLAAKGELGGGVAVTVMTNYGFHQAMEAANIEVAITDVGDRYVLEELVRRDWSLGGEQSGHIIHRAFLSTGDGLAGALLVLEALVASGKSLAAADVMQKLPQLLVNVTVADRAAIAGATTVWQAVEAAQTALEGRGRVLVRASGTEPLVRVMAEAPTEAEAAEVCNQLAALIKSELA